MVELALVVVLIAVNAALAGSELAVVSLSDTRIQTLAERGPAGRRLAEVAGDPNRFLSTIQVGITVAGFLASATAAVSLAEPLVEPLGFLGGAADAVAVVLVTAVLSYLTLVLGELAPKRLAMQRAEGWALKAARPIGLLASATRPAVWLLARSTDLVVRLFGGDPDLARAVPTEDELRGMVAAQQELSEHQRSMIEGALELDDRHLWQVLTPRSAVISLDGDAPVETALVDLAQARHARAPVTVGGDLDQLVGVIHLRELVGVDGRVAEHTRPAVLLPESMLVIDALRRLQAEREQMAVVLDEHGGTAGVVTVEDLLEEIVGEIYDEFDTDLGEPVWTVEGDLELAGSFPAHDLGDLGIELESEPDDATVGGLVVRQLGRLAEVGDEVELAPGTLARVTALDGRAIATLRLVRAPEPPSDDEE